MAMRSCYFGHYLLVACALAELVAEMEVEAFVVDIANASHADDAGVLNPLIKRYHAGLIALRLFASPPVRVRTSQKSCPGLQEGVCKGP